MAGVMVAAALRDDEDGLPALPESRFVIADVTRTSSA